MLTSAFALFFAGRVQQALGIGVPVRASLPFWYGLAIFMLLDGGYATYVLFYEPASLIPAAVLMARRLAFLIGVASLVVMLLTWTKLPGLRVTAVGYYAILITFVEAQTLYQNPTGHEVLAWSIQFVYT